MKRTPLFDRHVALRAKIVDFAGWEMPVQYAGILEEHQAVRSAAGLFDVSHMGEIFVQGPDAPRAVQSLLCNALQKQKVGQAIYSPMTNAQGGVVDDILAYRLDETEYLLVVNASNTDKDEAWIREQLAGYAVQIDNRSAQYGQLALQGPSAQAILQPHTDADLAALRFFRFLRCDVVGVPALLSRSGYTGEDGFELYLPAEQTGLVWDTLIDSGAMPIGLGARDTLRLEAALPLYGHELSDTITPLEAGLSQFVKLEGAEFIGREALREQAAQGVPRKRIGLRLVDKGVARAGYALSAGGVEIGEITSGAPSPSLGANIALALVRSDFEGDSLHVSVRGKTLLAQIVPLPFYQKQYKK